jgi:hypothetical protein
LLIQILLESDNKADGKTPIAVPTPVIVDNEPETETEMPPNGRQYSRYISHKINFCQDIDFRNNISSD